MDSENKSIDRIVVLCSCIEPIRVLPVVLKPNSQSLYHQVLDMAIRIIKSTLLPV
jgi:hypothetical protein